MVDEEKRLAMPYIYEAMDKANEAIRDAFDGKEEKYKDAWEIIDKRWNSQLHKPLHAAAHYLNPQFLSTYTSLYISDEIGDGFILCVERLIPNFSEQENIYSQVGIYSRFTGSFGRGMTIRQRCSISSVKWWRGTQPPKLRIFSIKVLSLTCFSGSEEPTYRTRKKALSFKSKEVDKGKGKVIDLEKRKPISFRKGSSLRQIDEEKEFVEDDLKLLEEENEEQ
ncbi:hAT transposon superfamily [Striga asiatica]|uniref:HAT transposon superfamily n=1 Tax=Striga asiatica TaxID=4170 RepID=A0A5A7PNA8_STRAF|nr:hAT transposon superfamily [Striga asiatica]